MIMNIEECREYILTLPLVEECQPFDEEIIVYKIGGRWFAVVSLLQPENISVKCNPDRAILLRDEFSAITPAWHFNKRHWNNLHMTILPTKVVKREIKHSYFTVIRKNVTPKTLREEILQVNLQAGLKDDTEI